MRWCAFSVIAKCAHARDPFPRISNPLFSFYGLLFSALSNDDRLCVGTKTKKKILKRDAVSILDKLDKTNEFVWFVYLTD